MKWSRHLMWRKLPEQMFSSIAENKFIQILRQDFKLPNFTRLIIYYIY
jgi:hypothetical protein